MKFYDTLTQLYKNIQKKDLPVYIETEDHKKFYVTTQDHYFVHSFNSRKEAVDFCKFLELKIVAFVTHK
jgi:hypothetical protein